tara:strand:+ start:222 stop:416 length:195 start_codon:yes stop_codon:yes gene_type:complete
MYHECEAAEEITVVLTKKELYVLRMAAMRTANVMAQDMTPTAQTRVDLIDLATEKLEQAFYGVA